MDNRQWFKEAGYGMMAHWGLYSLLAGEYRGRRVGLDYAEWIQSYMPIPNAEYEQLAKCFNPIYFNADEWIKLAKDAGMKYFVLTSKHHDGFALFHSKVDKFNVVDATPFKRDVVEELANACARHDIKLGLYYSQELDWHHPHGGGYDQFVPCSGTSWDNNWDWPDRSAKNFDICFEEKIKPQVQELLTNYGELCLIWFDVPHTISPEQSLELNKLVKRYQPDCLINSRIGNGIGDYHSTGDNQHDFDAAALAASHEKHSVLSGLYECPATLNDTWGYKPYDNNWKSPQEVLDLLGRLDARGVNLLLNVGPDPLGRIPAPAQEIFRAVGRRLQK